jgi:lipopolysaccharide/colanic/teichoic acid biosynthesis glycosyltransferase
MRIIASLLYQVVERLFALLMFFLCLPVVLLAAVAIRMDSPGSPFFFQTRVGKNGKPFRIFKLRGMYVDAGERFPQLYDYSRHAGLDFYFHHEVDPRLTRVGAFLRSLSIDELPNFWNVISGEMRLVGPRPEIPEVLALYGDYRDEYLSVKPGITCLSKVSGRDRLTKRETILLDLDYIRRADLKLDLTILWQTFRSVVMRKDVFHKHEPVSEVPPAKLSSSSKAQVHPWSPLPSRSISSINELDNRRVQP